VLEIYTKSRALKAGEVKVYKALTLPLWAIKKALPHAEERLFKQAFN
jgi:hypothetical protein